MEAEMTAQVAEIHRSETPTARAARLKSEADSAALIALGGAAAAAADLSDQIAELIAAKVLPAGEECALRGLHRDLENGIAALDGIRIRKAQR